MKTKAAPTSSAERLPTNPLRREFTVREVRNHAREVLAAAKALGSVAIVTTAGERFRLWPVDASDAPLGPTGQAATDDLKPINFE